MVEFIMQRGKENPVLMEILNNYQNRRQMIRYLGPPDMQLPEEDARRWVQRDMQKLIEQAPVQTLEPDPMTGIPTPKLEPSIKPNSDLLKDYWDEAIEAVVIYGLRNGGQLM